MNRIESIIIYYLHPSINRILYQLTLLRLRRLATLHYTTCTEGRRKKTAEDKTDSLTLVSLTHSLGQSEVGFIIHDAAERMNKWMLWMNKSLFIIESNIWNLIHSFIQSIREVVRDERWMMRDHQASWRDDVWWFLLMRGGWYCVWWFVGSELWCCPNES